VLQLKLLNGSRAGADFVATHFPVTVGRSSANDFRLVEPGVWDRHFEIDLTPPATFELKLHEQALATVNDAPVRSAELSNGDEIGSGSLKIQFSLSPTEQRSMRWREILVWTAFVLLCLGQVALVYWLPG
jgi:pSer/pThr/pTyr-binding forkhead associated (FHA) protein